MQKCRDRLYAEFVLAGVATSDRRSGKQSVLYGSGIDLLKKTPEFAGRSTKFRLDQNFHHAYRHINVLFDGRNPYIESIDHNLNYLGQVIERSECAGLRRPAR